MISSARQPYAAHEGAQVKRIDGPTVRLQPKAAENFALLIHELATNAVKYGALSSKTGRVEVRWRIGQADGAARLAFDWIETGVRVADGAPRRRGFGTELIERTIAYELGADTSLRFEPDGLRCTIALPLTDGIALPTA
jgi:two-component system CheB/CheR fusion protein